MNACRSASCGAFRRHPGRRPRTFWHCPKGAWTSKRLAFLCWVREAGAASLGGFRGAPATLLGAPRDLARRDGALPPGGIAWLRALIFSPLACSATGYRVGDETRMNNVSSQHDFTKQDRRAGHLG